MPAARYKRPGTRKAAPVPAKPAPVANANIPRTRLPARNQGRLRAARGTGVSAMMHAQGEIAAPYEIGSEVARMPVVGNAGPIALAGHQANIRKVARHLMRTDGIMKSAFAKIGESVVGTGPVPRTKFRELLPIWRIWAAQCIPTGKLDFGGMVEAVYVDSQVAGDALVRMRPREESDGLIIPLQLQCLESEFLPFDKTEMAGGNRIITGIEIDPIDRPAAYWLYQAHPFDRTGWEGDTGLPERVEAKHVLHVANPARLGGYRGESRAVVAMVNLWRLHGYVDAEMVRKKTAATIAGFIQDTKDQDVDMPGMSDEDADEQTNGMIDFLDWELGMMIKLPSSTEVTFPNVSDPSGNAMAFLKYLGLIISASIGVPYPLLFGDWEGVSDRTAVFEDQHFHTFVQKERRRLEVQLLNPIWKRFVDLCIATGLWEPPEGTPQHHWYDMSWVWPQRNYKHPVQDVESKIKAITAGLTDRDTVIEEAGGDPEEVDLRQAISMRRAKAYGLTLTTHDGAAGDTDLTLRLDGTLAGPIDRMIAEIETSEADEGAFGE